MGTRPGLPSIPHISGILLLMQLLLLQPLVNAKAETSAAVDARFEASPAKLTDFKQERDALGFRVFITFEGNPHYRGIEELVKVSTNGWNETFSEPRDNTTKFKRTFEFVIPEEFKFHQFAIVFGKEVHIFQLEVTGFDEHANTRKYVGLVNYLSEKVKYMMPDYGVGWMLQVVRKELDGWMSQVVRKELDNIIYTQTNLSDHLRQLKTDIESIKAKLPESFDGSITIDALNKLQEITGFSLRTAISPYRHIKYIFVEKNMDRDTAEAACTLLDGTLASSQWLHLQHMTNLTSSTVIWRDLGITIWEHNVKIVHSPGMTNGSGAPASHFLFDSENGAVFIFDSESKAAGNTRMAMKMIFTYSQLSQAYIPGSQAKHTSSTSMGNFLGMPSVKKT